MAAGVLGRVALDDLGAEAARRVDLWLHLAGLTGIDMVALENVTGDGRRATVVLREPGALFGSSRVVMRFDPPFPVDAVVA